MKYHELAHERHKKTKRAGRGNSSGHGKTAGRGTKGQLSRTGSSMKPGFEGGQNPLMQRLPKLPGFKSLKPKNEVVLTGQLDKFAGKTVDTKTLADAGLISSPYAQVKLLSKGDVTKKVTVKLPAASASAIAMIEKAGGTFQKTERTPNQTKQNKSE